MPDLAKILKRYLRQCQLSVSGTNFGIFKQHYGAVGNSSSFMFRYAERRGGNFYKMIYCDISILMKACAAHPPALLADLPPPRCSAICPMLGVRDNCVGERMNPRIWVFLFFFFFTEIPKSSEVAGFSKRGSRKGPISLGLSVFKDAPAV